VFEYLSSQTFSPLTPSWNDVFGVSQTFARPWPPKIAPLVSHTLG